MPPKRNAFYNFMVKRRAEMEGQGLKFPGGWREVSLAVALEWSRMSLEDKAPFMPDQGTISMSPSPTTSGSTTDLESGTDEDLPVVRVLNSDDEPERPTYDELTCSLDEVLKNAIREGRKQYFNGEIESFTNAFDGKTEKQIILHKKVTYFEDHLEKKVSKLLFSDNIPDMVFILMTFNTWCKTTENKYIPSEIALLAFSMRKGIIDQFATPVDPGAFPPGYGYDAKVQADKLFLPVPPFDADCRDYPSILGKINEFVDKYTDEDSSGYLFCLRKEMRIVYGCLQWLIGKVGVSQDFELYPFEYLVMKLSKFVASDAVIRAEGNSNDSYSLPYDVDSVISGNRLSDEDDSDYFASVSGLSSYSDRISVSDNDSECSSTYSRYSSVTITSQSSSASTVTQGEKIISAKGENCFNSEVAVLKFIDRLIFGSMEFFGCLHHMFYSDVVHRCALNRLNRYAFQTLDLLILNFGIMPVNGVNFIDTKFPNVDEMDKRKEMLENWGLRFKVYPGYTTPFVLEEERAAEVARLNASLEDEEEEPLPIYFPHGPESFWDRQSIPEFMAVNPEIDEDLILPSERRFKSGPSSTASCSTVTTKASTSSFISTNDELFSDIDDDGWSFVEDH